MAKFTPSTKQTNEEDLFSQLKRHHDLATREMDKRRTGAGRVGSISFDEADELFRSWINESKWPYDALLFDPRVLLSLLRKIPVYSQINYEESCFQEREEMFLPHTLIMNY